MYARLLLCLKGMKDAAHATGSRYPRTRPESGYCLDRPVSPPEQTSCPLSLLAAWSRDQTRSSSVPAGGERLAVPSAWPVVLQYSEAWVRSFLKKYLGDTT